MRRLELAACCAIAACASPREVRLPDLDLSGTVASEILAVQRNNGGATVLVHHFDGEPFELPFELASGDVVEIEARIYTTRLDFPEGPLEPAMNGDLQARPLPPTGAIFATTVTEHGAEPWSTSTGPVLARFRYHSSEISPYECVDRGGCFATATATACDVACDRELAIEPPMPPAPPMPAIDPRLAPCVPGWHEPVRGDEDEVKTCEPWSFGERNVTCPDGQARFPSDPGCRDLGATCPAGEWPELPPSGRMIAYVRAGGAPGGDGSMMSPFATIHEAYDSGAEVIALGKGTHTSTAALVAARPVEIAGACAAETILHADVAPDVVTISVKAATVVIRDLAMDHGGSGAILVFRGDAEISGVEVRNGYALSMVGGSAHVQRLRARDVEPGAIWLDAGAVLTATSVEITGASGDAISVLGARTSLVLRDLSLRDAAQNMLGFGAALLVADGAHAEISRAVLEQLFGYAVLAKGTGTELALTDTIARVVERAYGGDGRGVIVREGAKGDLTRVLVEGTSSTGVTAADDGVLESDDLVVRDSGSFGVTVAFGAKWNGERTWIRRIDACGACAFRSEMSGTDLTVLDVWPSTEEADALGAVTLRETSTVTLERVVLARPWYSGIFSVGSTGVFRDVTVSDVSPNPMKAGPALSAINGSDVSVERGVFERSAIQGVNVGALDPDAGRTNLHLVDVEIRDVANGLAIVGAGIDLSYGPDDAEISHAVLERVAIRRVANAGIRARVSSADLTDVLISETKRFDNGFGIWAEHGAVVTGRRVATAGCEGQGLYVLGNGTSIELEHFSQTDSKGSYAFGIEVNEGAKVKLDHFRLAGNELYGLLININGGDVDLETGEIADNEIAGAFVRVDYDLRRLAVNVRYAENQQSILYAIEP